MINNLSNGEAVASFTSNGKDTHTNEGDPIQALSDLIVHSKYAKHIPELQRRETYKEVVDRNKDMHLKKFPQLKEEIEEAYKLVYAKKVLPSMRSMQFGGKPIELNPSRIYNCSFLPMEDWRAFQEVMFMLLGGPGVGYSVQFHHVEKLPEIHKPNPDRRRRFLIGDSIEGWADAIKVLMKSYFFGGPTIDFDFSDIREKGMPLITSGGKAPGPEPLRLCLVKIESLLSSKEDNSKLEPIEVHDINCHMADAVLSGGIRRAAMIALFSADDSEMISCKSGNWYELNPQRGRANNSAVLLRHRVSKEFFMSLWERMEASRSGEPGIYFTNDKELGCNPCCEIALRPYQFCNLTEINAANITSQEDLNERARVASFIGTLQATYTNFHYLRPIWQRTTEKDALIGVSMTGIASMNVFDYDIKEAAKVVKSENARVAKLLGINQAARTTCVKPAGTTSLVLGTSSGIHPWFAPYYVRRVRLGKEESIYKYLAITNPEVLEDDYFKPASNAIMAFPQKAPEGSVYRDEPPLQLLDRIKIMSSLWVKEGHRTGDNTHNVSATIPIKDDEWEKVGLWMWNNRDFYNGLSVIPYDGGTYKQMPFEEITKEEYEKMIKNVHKINPEEIFELTDNTALNGELACSGGSCEIV